MLVLALVLLAAVQNGFAGTEEGAFAEIPWPRTIGKTIPEYTLTVPLGKNYSGKYQVRLEYPEYVEINSGERKALHKLGFVPADTITVNTELGVSRKAGILDIAFVPVLKRNGHWARLKSCKIVVEKQAESMSNDFALQSEDLAASAERYASHSVLASGKWAKIRVREEGVYALTKSQLSQLGFADLSRVKVYGYGGRPENAVIDYGGVDGDFDDLEEVPLYRRSNDLLFYANGTIKWSDWALNSTTKCYYATHKYNPYSSYSYYFITEGDSVEAFPVLTPSASVAATTLTSFPDHALIDNEEYSWYTSGSNLYESYNYGESGNSRNYTLATAGIDASQNAQLYIAFTAASSSRTAVTLTQNGTQLGTINVSALSTQYDHAMLSTRTFLTNSFLESNTINIKTTSGHDARLDYLRADYMRSLKLGGSELKFSHYVDEPANLQLSGANASTQVWRVGYSGNPTAQVPATLSGSQLNFLVDNPQLRYVAVDVSGSFPSPESVGSVANQDLHADSACDLLIIIPQSGKLLAQAQRLAQAHKEKDGLRVRIVAADKIYNEFSSGTPDAGAYRRYLKMLYDRAETDADMPKYLLLMGGSVWDNRMLTSEPRGLSASDYLLCYESEASLNETTSYVSDDFFGFLDDAEGGNLRTAKIDIGIGRIPVTTASDAETVVTKIINYMDNGQTGAWKNNIYMIADDGYPNNDGNTHMEDEEVVTQSVESAYPALSVSRVYEDAYERVVTSTGNTYPTVTSLLKNAMNNGALVMNYSGHGAPYQVSHEQILKLSDFKEFTSSKIPLWVVASCEITPFDMLEETIGETALLNKTGAAIAFYSSARAVYSTQNRILNRYFMNNVLSKDDSGKRLTLGDAARLTKVNLVTTGNQTDFTDNKLKYVLVGDPAMTLAMPTYKVVVDKINGISAESSSLAQLKAGSVATVSGHIEDYGGAEQGNFKGTVSLTLWDSKDTITCRNNANCDVTPFTYSEYTKKLYEGTDSVSAGKFEMKVPVPLDIKYTNLTGKLNFYAVNTDNTIEANGVYKQFTVGGTESGAATDSVGPKLFLYLNNPDFKDGDVVNDTPYFFANLSDENGINATGNGVGHDLELVIDGDESQTYILNDYYSNDFGSYTSGTVSYMIPEMTAGKHKLFFRAWDMKNKSSSAVLNFIVNKNLQPNILNVAFTNNPAYSSTNFIISYDRPQTETTFTLKVYDCYGRLWYKHEETATSSSGYYTIPWNLTSNSGVALNSGLYICEVGVSCNDSKEATKTAKLIIHRQ